MTSRNARSSARSLQSAIAAALREALLPGDSQFTDQGLADAARLVFEAASQRPPGEPVIAIESVTGRVGERLTRIAVINDDMPFLVDSIAATVGSLGLGVDRLVHPVISAARKADGTLEAIGEGDARIRESMIYMEAPRADARTRAKLRNALESTLADVRVAVADWPKLQAAMLADADRLATQGSQAREDAALLRWLNDNMLTQLGHVTRYRDGRQADVLGVCRRTARSLLSAISYERTFAWFEHSASRAMLIIKSNRICQVHRRVPLDLFIVPVREGKQIVALSVHAGVWTSAALAAPPGQVPRMRAQLDSLMKRLDFSASGHAGKALVHALTRLPHDLLIAFEDADLRRVATSMMSLFDRPRPRLVLVAAPLRRHVFAFVWLPRDALSTVLRQQIVAMLMEAAQAEVLDWSLEVEGSDLAMLRFVLDIRDGGDIPDEAALEARYMAMVRGWPEAVEAELAQGEDPARAAAIAARFADAFPLGYRTASGPAEAARDIRRLRGLGAGAGSDVPQRDARLVPAPDGEAGQLHLKLYQRQGAIKLSDAVPMLENFGFRVIGEVPTLLEAGTLGSIHDFQLELPAGLDAADLLARSTAIEASIAAVLNGHAENDAFNRLVTVTGLAAQEAEWLRAWFRYLRQAGLSYSIPTVVDALQNAPLVARGLIDLFVARHDPQFPEDRERAETRADRRIGDGLAGVGAINDDRLLRQYRALVGAILRTNAFVPTSARPGETALAFKFDSAAIPGLPKPVPWREIFVYSQRVEGIHLRAGPIARGGLRWSDRRDDFRTEVLGLMKAQRVKNAVIVPTGAKGGFYPKRLPDPARDREGWLVEGKASYVVFVRSLLSLTDNIVGRRIVHPRHMVIRDGDDPYFVVAADKGTATYSDTANALAAERDFWLDDAFASGGSKGYDHKAMGITARGAWLSVRRHFLELGVDVQSQPVRVAGCGDMSGDVFGNGMLLSKAIRLVAAFDHRHIFLDPEPDPAKSWEERARMFALPRSSWEDYDKSLISKGGGVYPRSLKSIPLSPQVRAMLAIDAETLDPEALITAILKSQVDLLWFGGIGTYVKASTENNVQVGDPANDSLRVNGEDLRAKVIGEGANLGCTQAGRIEFALSGGRLNTDFIDNSAGVDCSDNEVNIKIALAAAKREERLTEKDRVKVLVTMTDEVADIVLEDNRLQTLALSIAEAGGAAATPSHLRLIEMLEERGQLDRKTEGLAESDVLGRRAIDGTGLSRPELSVLLSSAKLALQEALEASALPEDAGLAEDLVAAFPPAMRKRYRNEILDHRLRREIIATKLANRMVNRLGIVHPFELVEEEGATLAQVTAAFVAAERLFGMGVVWQSLETAPMSETARILAFDRLSAALRPQIGDLLRAGAGTLEPSGLVARLATGIRQLTVAADRLLGSEARGQSERLRTELTAAGVPDEQARMVALLYDLDGAVGIAQLSHDLGVSAANVARGFVDLGARLGLDWAQAAAARLTPSDPWERLLVSGVARDFQQMRLEFLRRVTGSADQVENVAGRWAEMQDPAIRQFRSMIARAKASVSVSPAMLAQLAGQARNLLTR